MLTTLTVHDNNFHKIVESHRTLFGLNLPVNAFGDFSQTAYAEDNTPKATGDCLKKLIGSRNRKSLKNIAS